MEWDDHEEEEEEDDDGGEDEDKDGLNWCFLDLIEMSAKKIGLEIQQKINDKIFSVVTFLTQSSVCFLQ